MLELKHSLEEGVNHKIEIKIVGIRKSQKPERNVSKKDLKLRKLIVISLFNPRYCIELYDILRTKLVKGRGI
jgi:hypothetical protein